jgi:hypothetical protein
MNGMLAPDNVLQNPWLAMGLSLLSAPRLSREPHPGIGAPLLQGLALSANARQQADENAMRRRQMEQENAYRSALVNKMGKEEERITADIEAQRYKQKRMNDLYQRMRELSGGVSPLAPTAPPSMPGTSLVPDTAPSMVSPPALLAQKSQIAEQLAMEFPDDPNLRAQANTLRDDLRAAQAQAEKQEADKIAWQNMQNQQAGIADRYGVSPFMVPPTAANPLSTEFNPEYLSIITAGGKPGEIGEGAKAFLEEKKTAESVYQDRKGNYRVGLFNEGGALIKDLRAATRKDVGKGDSDEKPEFKPGQALKRVSAIDAAVARLKSGGMVDAALAIQFPALAGLMGTKDKVATDAAIASLMQEREYMQDFLPEKYRKAPEFPAVPKGGHMTVPAAKPSIPQGAELVGKTKDGRPAYKLPDGRYWTP